jgi:hypothetical protein
MAIYRTKNAAMKFFLRHSSGSITVEGKDGKTAEVDCYPDAVAFFDEHGEWED